MRGEDAVKRCPRCGRLLPRSAFGRSSRYKDGLTWWCRECNAEAARRFRRKKAEADARKRMKAVTRMMAVAIEDEATVHIAGKGDVTVSLPKIGRLRQWRI